MSKKIKFICLIFTLILLIAATKISVFASDINSTELFDSKYSEGTYKTSSDSDQQYLPYLRYSESRIIVDKELNKSGLLFSKGPIDVLSKLSGINLIASKDTVRVNAETEFPVIIADNVVIDSNVNRTLFVFANTITITQNAKISEDVICYAKQIDVLGTVNGSIIGRVNIANIYGNIQKDLRLKVYSLNLNDSSKIFGNVYISTSNKDLNVSAKYQDAKVVFEQESINKTEIVDILKKSIVNSLLFALLYIFIYKISNNKVFNKMKDKAQKHPIALILTSILNLILSPFIILVLIILSLLGFGIIAVPFIFIYLLVFILSIALSTFITGSTIFNYVSEKYLSKYNKLRYMFIGSFVTYLVLYLLVAIPVLGSYISMFLVMVSIGLVFMSFIKLPNNNLQIEKSENDDQNISQDNKQN